MQTNPNPVAMTADGLHLCIASSSGGFHHFVRNARHDFVRAKHVPDVQLGLLRLCTFGDEPYALAVPVAATGPDSEIRLFRGRANGHTISWSIVQRLDRPPNLCDIGLAPNGSRATYIVKEDSRTWDVLPEATSDGLKFKTTWNDCRVISGAEGRYMAIASYPDDNEHNWELVYLFGVEGAEKLYLHHVCAANSVKYPKYSLRDSSISEAIEAVRPAIDPVGNGYEVVLKGGGVMHVSVQMRLRDFEWPVWLRAEPDHAYARNRAGEIQDLACCRYKGKLQTVTIAKGAWALFERDGETGAWTERLTGASNLIEDGSGGSRSSSG